MHEFHTKLPLEDGSHWAKVFLDWNDYHTLPELVDVFLIPENDSLIRWIRSPEGKLVMLAIMRDALALNRYTNKEVH